MNEIPAELEAKWREEHYNTAEEAFARVAEEGQQLSMPSFFQKAEAVLQKE